MRTALNNLNTDLVRQYPDYVCRVTADEGDIGRGHSAASRTSRPESRSILTTSQLLTTGVDAPTCKNVVLARVVGSMSRVQADHRPRHARARRLRQALLQHPRLHRLRHAALRRPRLRRRSGAYHRGGDRRGGASLPPISRDRTGAGRRTAEPTPVPRSSNRRARGDTKYYFDGGQVEIAAHLVYELDPTASSSGWCATPTTRRKQCGPCSDSAGAAAQWADPEQAVGDYSRLAGAWRRFRRAGRARPSSPTPTRSTCSATSRSTRRCARAASARSGCEATKPGLLRPAIGPEARQVLDELLEKYAEHGDAQFVLPDVLEVPPISEHGQNVRDHRACSAAPIELRQAVTELQDMLYAA